MQIKYSNVGVEPITLQEVKDYCKIDFADEDALITGLITSVREHIEEFTGLALVIKTIEYFDEEIEDEIRLPYPTHDSITEVKVNGSATDSYTSTGLIQFIVTPPTTFVPVGSEGGFYCKYTTTGDCPQAIKDEMKRLLLEKYEQRGNTFMGAISELSENSYSNLMKFVVL
jgi:hypothetical protein